LHFFELSFSPSLIESISENDTFYPFEERSKVMRNDRKSLWSLLGLIVAVSAVLAYVAADNNVLAGLIHTTPVSAGPVTVGVDPVQDKVLAGSDGQVGVSLTLTADQIEAPEGRSVQNADLVIVLDRSGSMAGRKLEDARQAVMRLIDHLTAQDRLALVTYSNGVEAVFPLVYMDGDQRNRIRAAVQQIYSSGGTNLGGGLQQGIATLMQTPAAGRQRRVILISDGLANQGITDPTALGRMAAGAVEQNFAVSTVGVGYDFNEVLMTTIADHGAGRYYFLEDPKAFAQVFEQEFQATRNVAAAGLEIRVPLKNGMQVTHAGGYPVQIKDGWAVVHPGDLLSGQQRKLFLTLKVPTDREGDINLGTFDVTYQSNGEIHHLRSKEKLILACVADKKAVLSSIDQAAWGNQVVQEDYNLLKEKVADAIRKGEKGEALKQIRDYETRNRVVNAAVGSGQVASNLEKDLPELRQSVEETFVGPASAVAEKQKQASKALQYESYRIRRDKK
jgi:Ca-activated chloride channel family protein